MDDDISHIVPHIPFFCANGNQIVREWTERFVDRLGNVATLHKVEYCSKKGKISEATRYVVWEDQ